jgi:hypothetical protein
MKTAKLLTVDLNQVHRGEPKLYVNEGIRGNIGQVLGKLEESFKPGDCIFDLRPIRCIHGEFTILRTSHRDADHNAVRDILNQNSGLIRIRMGEILSFKIFDGPFLRVWVTFDGADSKVSWALMDSGMVTDGLAQQLEYAVRVREGKIQAVASVKTHSLKNAFTKANSNDWSPLQPELHVVTTEEAKGRKTPKATRVKKTPKISNMKKTGTEQ